MSTDISGSAKEVSWKYGMQRSAMLPRSPQWRRRAFRLRKRRPKRSLPSGYAGTLIRRAVSDAKRQGRRGLVLTCKQALIPYYARFGFADEGVSEKSTHGNVVWHQMRLSF